MLTNEEIASITLCLLLFAGYHILYTVYILRDRRDSTRLSANFQNAYLWVSKHFTRSDAASCTLAVHVLRNTILIGIFVGGTSFTTAYSFLNSFPGKDVNSVSGIRAIIISALMFSSFLNWAAVIRCVSHLGYLLGSSADEEIDERVGETYVERMGSLTHNTTYHFSLGFRFIFMSIPFALLSAGITALLISTVLMLIFLFETDYRSLTENNTNGKQMYSIPPHVTSDFNI